MNQSFNAGSLGRIAIMLLGLVGAVCLTGCGSVGYSGRVVVGPADIAVVVPAEDPRLTTSEGVPGTLVEFLDDKGNRIGSATSGSKGEFGISVPVTNAPTRAVTVRASGAAVRASETSLYLPRDGGRVLVNVTKNPSNAR
ncbi:MAG: hypothetical protein KF912_08130 [Phycisphaeraceae bacterium]|nr:hypothetical protein [Phycisphaeraceae bacterium]MBX3367269.1 hypothetical protein [Phycisphaeraceae bacterium]QYK49381.1 MAG: hypothetical protein KF838_05890 [Phycisphaeraceae bacterium]